MPPWISYSSYVPGLPSTDQCGVNSNRWNFLGKYRCFTWPSSLLAYSERRIEHSISKIPLKMFYFSNNTAIYLKVIVLSYDLHIITRTRGTQIWKQTWPPFGLWRHVNFTLVWQIWWHLGWHKSTKDILLSFALVWSVSIYNNDEKENKFSTPSLHGAPSSTLCNSVWIFMFWRGGICEQSSIFRRLWRCKGFSKITSKGFVSGNINNCVPRITLYYINRHLLH